MNTETTVSGWVVLKNIGYLPAVLVGLEMQNYGILAAFIILDVITGAWRSATINGGPSVTSWKAINGLVSKFLFLLIPLIVAYMGKALGLDLKALAQSALGILTFATGYSIIGNIYTIRSGNAVKEFDAVRLILLQIEKLLSKLEPPTK